MNIKVWRVKGERLKNNLFHIGRPDPVSNCSITNRTYDALSISCDSGFDGGLSQEFGMEVYDTFSGDLIRNSTGSEPVFTVTSLFSGAEYDIRLYAYNSKGRSRIVPIQAFTLKSPQKHVGKLVAFSVHTVLLTADICVSYMKKPVKRIRFYGDFVQHKRKQ